MSEIDVVELNKELTPGQFLVGTAIGIGGMSDARKQQLSGKIDTAIKTACKRSREEGRSAGLEEAARWHEREAAFYGALRSAESLEWAQRHQRHAEAMRALKDC